MKHRQKNRWHSGKTVWWLIWAASAVLACKGRETKTPGTEPYADYHISGSGDQREVTCLIQFKRDVAARPHRLLPPSFVALDRMELTPDSSRLAGVYYEKRFPAATFVGKHQITFHNGDQPFTQSFSFQPFTLSFVLPDTISRRDFIIRTDASDRNGTFHLSLTDTSFASNDFYEIVTLTNGDLRLRPDQLNQLSKGPVVMEILYEDERPLQHHPGRIRMSYSLRREFLLTD